MPQVLHGDEFSFPGAGSGVRSVNPRAAQIQRFWEGPDFFFLICTLTHLLYTDTEDTLTPGAHHLEPMLGVGTRFS